jgi:hypothetical protein
MAEIPDKIPNQLHFVWDDNFFPYSAYLAIRSAALCARPDRILLYKTPALDGVPNFERLRREVDCLQPVNIDLPGWLAQAALPCTQQLLDAHRFLQERNYYGSVSDLLRTLNLYLRGGIYLDTDVLTLRNLAPLRRHGAFLAEEHILVSSKVWKRNSRWRYLWTGPLTAARHLCMRFAHGVRAFQLISPLYTRVVHNAVMGCRPGHPLMRDALLRIAERYPDRPKRYPLLGPDTLQDLIEEKTYDDLAVLPPHCFSPLGPTMTFQYFHLRKRRGTLEKLETWIVRPDTFAIHWSNNGTIAKSIPQSDDDLRRLEARQLFARLARRAVFPTGSPSHLGNA